MKTTPIPVKFDRQGHSCNFYAGFGPTCCMAIANCFDAEYTAALVFCFHSNLLCQETWGSACASPASQANCDWMKGVIATAKHKHCSHLSSKCNAMPIGSPKSRSRPNYRECAAPYHRVGDEPLKNNGSHIDASLSRQPLVKGERLVRAEMNAVINITATTICYIFFAFTTLRL